MSSSDDRPFKDAQGKWQNVDLTKAQGYKHEAVSASYNRRDVLLFANAIGVKRFEQHFLSELNDHFAAFPTFPINLAFKRNEHDVFDFIKAMRGTRVELPGTPLLDPNRSVDGERTLTVLHPIPVSSDGLDLHVENRCLGAWDRGSNLIVEHEAELVDKNTGKVYCKMHNLGVGMKQGGIGGPRGPDRPTVLPPQRQPDAVIETPLAQEVAYLYRLCGDYNPLHADDEFGRRAGFKEHILQGLGTWNFVAVEILRKFGASDPARFKKFGARFRSPVYAGDVLVTEAWKAGSEEGYDQIIFQTKIKSDGRIALSNGICLIKPEQSVAKL